MQGCVTQEERKHACLSVQDGLGCHKGAKGKLGRMWPLLFIGTGNLVAKDLEQTKAFLASVIIGMTDLKEPQPSDPWDLQESLEQGQLPLSGRASGKGTLYLEDPGSYRLVSLTSITGKGNEATNPGNKPFPNVWRKRRWLGVVSMNLRRRNCAWPTWQPSKMRWLADWTRGERWIQFILILANLLVQSSITSSYKNW